jgi:undecaprenyl diphosphate synthase
VHSGDLSALPQSVRKEIQSVTRDTAENDSITVNLAVNYGGRNELVRAVNRWLESHRETCGTLTADELRRHLDLPDFPDPDLIIRTGGEVRLSNFLLWGSAYAELYFSEKLWPDWEGEDFREAIRDFQRRKRNFGGKR